MIAPVDVTKTHIETERLILRPWQERDLADFNAYASVDGVGQMAGWLPHRNMEESKRILNMFIADKKTLALELKENGKVIGSIGLEDIDFKDAEHLKGREIGYALSKAYWGRGLMPEAVTAVISYCFRELAFDWLTCDHFVWNRQSCRVIEKCGFQYVREEKRETRYDTVEPSRLYVQYNPYKVR